MPFSIPLTGLAANDPVPGAYLEINFAQGAASLGSATYPILLLGNKTSAGDAVLDTTVYGSGANSPLPLSSMQDWVNRFGQGSELHRMARRVLAVNKVTPIYGLAVTESAGAKATLVITFTVTATANGTARLFIQDEFVDVAITSGDTVTTVAGNAKAAINSKLDWAVTADNSAGVLTVTAKQKGLRGNWLRGSCVILGNSVGTTSDTTAQIYFTGGTTADSNTTALSTILPFRYYYIVSAQGDDATAAEGTVVFSQGSAVLTQVNQQAQPVTGIRQRVVFGTQTTAAKATTIATTLNGARAEVVWQPAGEWVGSELAANNTAIYALEEAPLAFRTNFDGYGNDAVTSALWHVPASKTVASMPTRALIFAALNNGVTPIATNSNGSTYLVKRVTTKSSTSSNPDYRISAAHKVTVCDRFGDDWLSICTLEFSGKKIANDPVAGQRPPAGDVVTPRVVRGALLKLLEEYNDLGLLQNVDDIKAAVQVIREVSPTTRMSCKIPLQSVDNLDQIATSLDQVA